MFEFAFNDLESFLTMGKYGAYVWLCFGLAFAVIKLNILAYRFKRKSIISEIQLDQARKIKQLYNSEK